MWVAAEYQVLRECVPGPVMSDAATKIMLNGLEQISLQVGESKFHEVILKAIETCERRPTLATLRKLAGLNARLSPQDEALARAWETVTVCVTRFLQYDGEGNVSLKSRVAQRDGHYFEEEPPLVPDGVLRAVRSMGGWKALVESYPTFWSHKFTGFKEVYVPSEGEQAMLLESGSRELAVGR